MTSVRAATEEPAERMLANLRAPSLPILQFSLGIRTLHKMGMSYRAIALRLGSSESVISKYAVLLDFPAEVQALLRDGRLTRTQGLSLYHVKSYPDEVSRLAAWGARTGWSLEAKAIAARRTRAAAEMEERATAGKDDDAERLQAELTQVRKLLDAARWEIDRHAHAAFPCVACTAMLRRLEQVL